MEGKAYLGIEFGSSRIKAVLMDGSYATIASGSHIWESKLEDGIWTYALSDVWIGLRECYASLASDYFRRVGKPLRRVDAIGVSAMMHGYLAFDAEGALLTPFRTWRNTNTGAAAAELSELFGFNIPQRWSIAHLYQAMLDGEEHVERLGYITTLAGYVHHALTGRRAVGVGDASGMFPIDTETGGYDEAMLDKFDALLSKYAMPFRLKNVLPKICSAGQDAGRLTREGAMLIDATGTLEPGIPLCPPEGDAATGMTATNSVGKRTGNVSAGTSVFAMSVLEGPLKGYYSEVDVVATPSGEPVAMVHCNNCSNEIDAWARLFHQTAIALGASCDVEELYKVLFAAANLGEADCGGLLAYNYISGEPITGFLEGRPMLVREPDSTLDLANFMRAQLYSAVATLRIGMDILRKRERVAIDKMVGHGGYFKAGDAGCRTMATALNTSVTVMETAGEGGPWGMAVLAAYMVEGSTATLQEYLDKRVFVNAKSSVIAPDANDMEAFAAFMERYIRGLAIQRAAVQALI